MGDWEAGLVWAACLEEEALRALEPTLWAEASRGGRRATGVLRSVRWTARRPSVPTLDHI